MRHTIITRTQLTKQHNNKRNHTKRNNHMQEEHRIGIRRTSTEETSKGEQDETDIRSDNNSSEQQYEIQYIRQTHTHNALIIQINRKTTSSTKL